MARTVKVRILFEPRDLWWGVFIKDRRTYYVCLVPCFPILLEVGR